MSGSMSQRERLLLAIAGHPGLDDDELSELTGIRPRQAVNVACRALEREGRVRRRVGARGKLVNELNETKPREPATPSKAALAIPGPRPFPAATLVVIPCSAGKRTGGLLDRSGPSVLDSLPRELAERLRMARDALRGPARVDESLKLPAGQRYARGLLYQQAASALTRLSDPGSILVLSGGYGLVRLDEPIGSYDRILDLAEWPRGLLQECMTAYAAARRVRHVVGLAGDTTEYARAVRTAAWQGVDDVVLAVPLTPPGGSPQQTVPRTLGAALDAFCREGRLPGTGWISPDGAALRVEHVPLKNVSPGPPEEVKAKRGRPEAGVVGREISRAFAAEALDLGRRPGAPEPGWRSMPEALAVTALRDRGADLKAVRVFITLTAALDRARDADTLWKAATRLHRLHAWAFEPQEVARRALIDVQDALLGVII
jgi:hypothetical protein